MTIRFTAEVRPWKAPNRKRPSKHAVELVIRADGIHAGSIVTDSATATTLKTRIEAKGVESAEIVRLRAQMSAVLDLLREALDRPGDERIGQLIAKLAEEERR